MITEKISALKIHKLTQEQYERELEKGNIDDTALYLTDSSDDWFESIAIGGTRENPRARMSFDEEKNRFVISVN